MSDPIPADGLIVTEPLTIYRELTPPDGQTIASWRITYRRVGTTTDVLLGVRDRRRAPARAPRWPRGRSRSDRHRGSRL